MVYDRAISGGTAFDRRDVVAAFDVFGNPQVVSESTDSCPVGAANPTWGGEYRAFRMTWPAD